ncbi:hypothetical protein ACH5RR_040096 [Cinchona calisaya]|uniref:Uncharacterized protein n=1 Tax=Cinchona calisaya TaxID=153742 RepID=A0ABD2XTB8_9GENT
MVVNGIAKGEGKGLGTEKRERKKICRREREKTEVAEKSWRERKSERESGGGKQNGESNWAEKGEEKEGKEEGSGGGVEEGEGSGMEWWKRYWANLEGTPVDFPSTHFHIDPLQLSPEEKTIIVVPSLIALTLIAIEELEELEIWDVEDQGSRLL